jgi:hypothetical protein
MYLPCLYQNRYGSFKPFQAFNLNETVNNGKDFSTVNGGVTVRYDFNRGKEKKIKNGWTIV